MSDALARKLTSELDQQHKKPKNHDERMVEALDKALKTTTIHRAGVPWEYVDEGDRGRSGYLLPGSDE